MSNIDTALATISRKLTASKYYVTGNNVHLLSLASNQPERIFLPMSKLVKLEKVPYVDNYTGVFDVDGNFLGYIHDTDLPTLKVERVLVVRMKQNCTDNHSRTILRKNAIYIIDHFDDKNTCIVGEHGIPYYIRNCELGQYVAFKR